MSEQTMIYVGVRRGQRIKRVYVYVPVVNGVVGVVGGEGAMAFRRPFRLGHVGRTCRVKKDEDGIAFLEWTGVYPDKEKVQEWQAEHHAVIAALEMETKRNKEAARDFLKDALEPARLAYGHMDARQRRAFLGWLIEYVTEGRHGR